MLNSGIYTIEVTEVTTKTYKVGADSRQGAAETFLPYAVGFTDQPEITPNYTRHQRHVKISMAWRPLWQHLVLSIRRRLLGQWTTSPMSFDFVERSHHLTLPLITQWAKDMQPSDYAGGK
jgi:hypothetical protein